MEISFFFASVDGLPAQDIAGAQVGNSHQSILMLLRPKQLKKLQTP